MSVNMVSEFFFGSEGAVWKQQMDLIYYLEKWKRLTEDWTETAKASF